MSCPVGPLSCALVRPRPLLDTMKHCWALLYWPPDLLHYGEEPLPFWLRGPLWCSPLQAATRRGPSAFPVKYPTPLDSVPL